MAGVVRDRHVRMNIAAAVERKADDLTGGIDFTSGGQIQGRAGGDECVEVDQIPVLPQERSEVGQSGI